MAAASTTSAAAAAPAGNGSGVGGGGGKTTLIYFPLRGRAEVPRLILEEAGAEYTFETVPFGQLAPLKPSLPFGQLPVLKVGEWQLPESLAISRFLAKKHGLYGSTVEAQAVADATVDVTIDSWNDFYRAMFSAPQGEQRTAAVAAWKKDKLPAFLAKIERAFELYGAASGFVAGELTYADLAVFNLVDMFAADVAAGSHAVLVAHHKAIAERPNVKAYITTRRP